MPRSQVTKVTAALLHRWPLPKPSARDDKGSRGRILVIGGSEEMPGAVILSALGALRAGAGKLLVATHERVVGLVAAAIPEARVIPFAKVTQKMTTEDQDAVVIGPGMQKDAAMVNRLLPAKIAMVLDAEVMLQAKGPLRHCVLTPHCGEMASLLDMDKAKVEANPQAAALKAAATRQAVVALKGPVTFVANQRGQLWASGSGTVGLATSGSGDVLSGVLGGLLARGATLEQAAVWANHVHGLAGQRLAKRIAPLGFLARELLDEIAPLLARWG